VSLCNFGYIELRETVRGPWTAVSASAPTRFWGFLLARKRARVLARRRARAAENDDAAICDRTVTLSDNLCQICIGNIRYWIDRLDRLKMHMARTTEVSIYSSRIIDTAGPDHMDVLYAVTAGLRTRPVDGMSVFAPSPVAPGIGSSDFRPAWFDNQGC
jgi:hypothetical protein